MNLKPPAPLQALTQIRLTDNAPALIGALLLTLICVAWSAQSGATPRIWLTDAFFAAVLLAHPPSRWMGRLALLYFAILLGWLVSARFSFSWSLLLLPLAGVFGALVLAGLMRRLVYRPGPQATNDMANWFAQCGPRDLAKLIFGCLVPAAALGAVTSATTLALISQQAFIAAFQTWLWAALLGNITLLPLMLVLVFPGAGQSFAAQMRSRHVAALIALLVLSPLIALNLSNGLLYIGLSLVLLTALFPLNLTAAAMAITGTSVGLSFGLSPASGESLHSALALIAILISVLFVAFIRRDAQQNLQITESRLHRSEQIRLAVSEGSPLFTFVKRTGHNKAESMSAAMQQYVFGKISRNNPNRMMDLFHPEDLEELENLNATLETGPGAYHCELRLKTYGDRYCWFRLTSYPAENSRKAINERIYVLHDIHRLKTAQSQLRRQTEELKRSNQALELFAVAASHDLQEPLRMVSAYTGLIKRRYSEKLEPAASEMMDLTIDAASRMSHLIQDLLRFSRVSSPEVNDSASIIEAVHNAQRLLKARIAQTGATVHLRQEIGPLQISQSGLNQVILNLISNAIRYRSGLAPVIDISLSEQAVSSPTPALTYITVQDNGIGIPIENHESIFEVFKRFKNDRAQEKSGSGIGLALCKRIIDSAGGEISIRSDGKTGTAVIIALKPSVPTAQTPNVEAKQPV